jgi:TPR repeat protein
MSKGYSTRFDPHRAIRRCLSMADRLGRGLMVAAAALMLLGVAGAAGAAGAATLRQGVSAFTRQEYLFAAQNFFPLAEQGDPAAQTYLGFMFETGRGVPKNFTEAAMWYRRAAEQGDSLAQYSLGLLYDRGQGVPQDIVEANKWLNLSTAAAPRRARDARARIRDAVTSKMTRGELARARLRALEWVPTRER